MWFYSHILGINGVQPYVSYILFRADFLKPMQQAFYQGILYIFR
jgi:hypothetical protein